MKRLLPLLFFLVIIFPASAQYTDLAIYGAAAGLSMLKGQPQKPTEYVTQAYYHNRPFQQKRTPANKLPKKGSSEIANLEQFLTSRHVLLQASDTVAILGSEQEADYLAARTVLSSARPLWSLVPYDAELDFYRREDARRTTARQQLARLHQRQRQARTEAARDSMLRVVLRRTHQADSAARAVAARQAAHADSLATSAQVLRAPDQMFVSVPAPVAARPATHHAAAAHQPVIKKVKVVTKTKRSTGPTVYYCASGNTVKYHASPGCRGLARCGASILPISLSTASMQMDPCKWCY